jgi:hypothetical protein
MIDKGHHNFHTREGRYYAFARLLERDGYVMTDYDGIFTPEGLEEGEILVISNALNKKNVRKWKQPVYSAFTEKEIEVVRQWVENGGRLFLIADHMPMGGAAKDLAAAFGFEFTDGFVFHSVTKGFGRFDRNNGLEKNEITDGRLDVERVDSVFTFTGQGFKIPEHAKSILTFDQNYVNYLPEEAWKFSDDTEQISVSGWSQGAYAELGSGKVVMFGEAAMFSAQIAGPKKNKMGMNNEMAPQNYQLLLNIIHWLD